LLIVVEIFESDIARKVVGLVVASGSESEWMDNLEKSSKIKCVSAQMLGYFMYDVDIKRRDASYDD